jgi:hypothetical protein
MAERSRRGGMTETTERGEDERGTERKDKDGCLYLNTTTWSTNGDFVELLSLSP